MNIVKHALPDAAGYIGRFVSYDNNPVTGEGSW
jgi:hypothetical protein